MTRDDRPATPAPDSPELQIDGVVHDVNQMLMVIIGRAEFLRRYGAAADLGADLETIEIAARDASAMLARLGSSGGGGQVAVADLAACVATAAGMIRPPGADAWISPGAERDAGAWVLANEVPSGVTVDLPPVLVREVLCNLLTNALAVLTEGGRITVEAAPAGDRMHLWVSDDGPGVPVDSADLIFAPGHTTSGEVGRGIGLAACRQVLGARGAKLDLVAPRQGGATFLLDLPAAAAPTTRPDPLPSVAGLAVLVVDDEPAVRHMLVDVLREWGCAVTAVADGAAARDACTRACPAVALIDVNLPDGPGTQLAAQLRERDPDLGVVVMTGLDRAGSLTGLDAGTVDAAVLKPVDLDDLRRVLATAAGMDRQRRPATPAEEEKAP